MKIRWVGLVVVLLAVAGVLVVKQRTARPPQAPVASIGRPSVLLVADLREADEAGDACAEIIRAVREAGKRGVPAQELMPNSNSDLIREHRVVTAPTVIVLGDDGRELVRFEGEGRDVLNAVNARLATLTTGTK